jgi:hypothetical protein
LTAVFGDNPAELRRAEIETVHDGEWRIDELPIGRHFDCIA